MGQEAGLQEKEKLKGMENSWSVLRKWVCMINDPHLVNTDGGWVFLSVQSWCRKGLSQGRLATTAVQGNLCEGNREPRSTGALLFPSTVLSLLVCELQWWCRVFALLDFFPSLSEITNSRMIKKISLYPELEVRCSFNVLRRWFYEVFFPSPLSLSLSSLASWVERAQTFVRDEHFQLRFKILKENRKKSYLQWGIRWSEILSILMTPASQVATKWWCKRPWAELFVMRRQDSDWLYPLGLNSSTTLWKCWKIFLGIYTSRESPEWSVCLSSIFTPFEIVWACIVTSGQNYLGWWKTHDKHMLLKVRMPSV